MEVRGSVVFVVEFVEGLNSGLVCVVQLAVQMDVLEEYLKIEKLDPTQVPDSAVKHKEESFVKMSNEFTAVESSGKQFIKDVSDVSDICLIVDGGLA